MRKLAILAVSLVFAVAMSISVSASDRVVQILGEERFVPNRLIASTFHFLPGFRRVQSGGSVTWVNRTDDEHTVTIVDEEDVPADFDEVFECRDPGGVCRAALDAHFGTDPPTLVINVGAAGLDAAGDSLLIEEGATVSAVVSAPAGTNLHYICSVHPWMQGEIEVV
jgi:plastocyanin